MAEAAPLSPPVAPAAPPASGPPHAEIANRRAILDRAALADKLEALVADRPAGGARAEILGALKQALADGRAEIRRRFDANHDNRAKGMLAVRANAYLLDQTIRTLYDFAAAKIYPIANPTAGERHAIVATGGYGRAELAPQSDIDLLFLLAYKLPGQVEQLIEYMLYMLWDLGLKVGHATRSLDDCLRMAKADQTIRTALLEARYLWGDRRLFDDLRKRFRDSAAADSAGAFLEAKLAERDARHQKLGDSRYFLEPNLKDGKGGLRDLHTLYWIAKYIYQVDDVAELTAKGVFDRHEVSRFGRALAFLTTVRCELHYQTGRPEERLTFDVRPGIARAMGYRDRTGSRGVERFMKHYYLVAKDVGDLTRIFCAALEAGQRRRPRFFLFGERKRDVEGFVSQSGRLNVARDGAFRDDPLNFLRLFKAAQDHDLDIHPGALRIITHELNRIDNALRENPAANRLFLEMLVSPKNPALTLRRLNEAGVFGRFVPDFGRIVAQMQHDMYHVFTVDEHTIHTIDLIHKIDSGQAKAEHPLASEIVHKVASRRVLYVAALLHDIAKGRGGDHSVLGAEVAEKLGPRLGLSAEETENVAWLVRHHLAMSNTAQRRDIDDPKTIADFAALVQSPERLKLLLVLTVADMRATSPKVWNNWKASLLRELYYRTEEVLAGTPSAGNVAARVEAAKKELAARLKSWPADEVEKHLARGYPGYWLSEDTETQARHAEQIRGAERLGETVSVETRVDAKRAVTEVALYTPDHAGLFSQIAGAMALSGANIVDARIHTLTNGWALDTLFIQDGEGNPVARADDIARLKQRIAESLTGKLRPGRLLKGKETLSKRAQDAFPVAPRVLIDNSLSRYATVVEVNGRDRPGLLYDVTRALTECGLQILSAKISTFGERVVDVFYVKDIFGMKVEHKGKQEQIRARVLESLGADAAQAAA